MGSWEWDSATGRYLWDEGQYRIFGVDPADFVVAPESIRTRVHPDDWHNLQIGFEQMAKDGHAHQLEFRVLRPDGRVRWCVGSAAATVNDDGRVARVSGVTFDITDRKEAEERQTLLAREVDHRAKNALALVQSILRLTRAKTLPAYVTSVEGRIKALSRAHAILSQSRWHGADLARPRRRGIGAVPRWPCREDQDLRSRNPSATRRRHKLWHWRLHELATNAAKYGALSSDSGQLKLSWTLKDGKLGLDWSESGGPITKPPSAEGFGTRIIMASIERQLCGHVAFDWRPEGLRCMISVPLCNTMGTTEVLESRGEVELATVDTRIVLAGGSIMLVEDEAIVALAVNDALTDMGFSVVGPFSRISDACRALRDNQVDAAILDINLAGETVYSLAEMLTSRKIPFVFATGYGAESIEARFEHIAVLQKPIEKEMLIRVFVRPDMAQAPLV